MTRKFASAAESFKAIQKKI